MASSPSRSSRLRVRLYPPVLKSHAKTRRARRGLAGDYTDLRALPRETRVPVPTRDKNF
ncbi:protein of unknown function [Methanoculleus bourgensis]|uniref:Uncharacterized protein n=1 Tax=Methanoculleus bourgensis TaxID=83986 RepID=A0A0X3BMH5_9EURY|nr:protein of unknown function [Methanoculleus bourgensis]